MVHIHSRKFCCCLPVRFGVFVMTLLGTLGGGAVAITLWVEIAKNGTFETGSNHDKLAAGLNAAAWTLLAVVSLFGLVGTIAKKAGFVALYGTLLLLNLILSVATGVLYIFVLFQKETKERAVQKCSDALDDTGDERLKDIKEDSCKAGYDVLRIVLITVFCFIWLFLLYGCVIVRNYVGQLHEEEALKMSYSSTSMQPYPAHAMQPMPIAPTSKDHRITDNTQEFVPLAAHDNNEYPYRAPQHSFGANHA